MKILSHKAVRAPVQKRGDGYQSRRSDHFIAPHPTFPTRWNVHASEGEPVVHPVGELRVTDDRDTSTDGFKTLGDARAALAVLIAEARGDARRARMK